MGFFSKFGDALIGAGSSLIGNIFGARSQKSANDANREINQMNNEFNERMMQKQMDYNTLMWYKNNAYNTPEAQRKRLEAAGLNPFLMMNGGSAGNAQSAGSTSMASASGAAPQQSFLPDFSGIPQSILMAKQGANIDADTQSKVMDNETRSLRNLMELHNLYTRTESDKLKNKLSRIQLNYADELEEMKIHNERARYNTQVEQAKFVEAQRILTALQGKRYNEIVDRDLAHKLAQIEIYADQRNLTAEQYRKEVYNTVVAEYQAKLGKVNYDIARQTADDIIDSTAWNADYGKVKDVLNSVYETIENVGRFGGRKPKMQLTKRRVGGNHKGDYYEDLYELR